LGDDNGVQVGDVLLMLDEEVANKIQKPKLIQYMRSRRPIKLTFLREAPSTGTTLEMSSVYSAAALMAKVVTDRAEAESGKSEDDDELEE